MKKLPVLLFLFISAITFVISSCGDDPAGPQNPSGSILFERDTMIVRFDSLTFSFGTDSTFFTISDAGSVSVEFNIQTNIDTPYAAGTWGFHTNTTPSYAITTRIYGPLEQYFFANQRLSSSNSFFGFAIRMNTYGSLIPRYVRLVGLKITKL